MKTYKVGLVGESKYQAAISRCRVGEPVEVLHEVGNPHDGKALRVDASGETIGYISRDNFVRDAVHQQGKGVSAVIAAIEGKRPRLGVVLDVRLTTTEIEIVGDFQQPSQTAASKRKARQKSGGLLAIIRGLFR